LEAGLDIAGVLPGLSFTRSARPTLSQLRELKKLGLTRDGRHAFFEGFDLSIGLSRIDGNANLLADFSRSQGTKTVFIRGGEGDINLFGTAFPGSDELL
jgi:hypothetical protein